MNCRKIKAHKTAKTFVYLTIQTMNAKGIAVFGAQIKKTQLPRELRFFLRICAFLMCKGRGRSGLPTFGHRTVLQALVKWTSSQYLALVLQLYHLHRGLRICFLCHRCVLLCLFIDDYLFTVHDVEALRGLADAAAVNGVVATPLPLNGGVRGNKKFRKGGRLPGKFYVFYF